MNLRSVNLNLLTVFDTMMVERNVTRAGAVLGLSQPAISNSIAQLRVLLNDRLFIRARNEMIPTACAQALADPIHKALAQVQAALARPRHFDPARSTANFRVGMCDFAALILFDRLMKQVCRQAKHVKLRVSPVAEGGLQLALDRGEIDLAIGCLGRFAGHAKSRVLLQDKWVCMRSSSKARQPLTLHEYLAADHALLGIRLTDEIDDELRQAGHRRNNVMNIPLSTAAGALIESSDILVTAPHSLALTLSHGRNVEVRDLPFAMRPVQIGLAWHSRTQLDEASIWLRNLAISLTLEQPTPQVA